MWYGRQITFKKAQGYLERGYALKIEWKNIARVRIYYEKQKISNLHIRSREKEKGGCTYFTFDLLKVMTLVRWTFVDGIEGVSFWNINNFGRVVVCSACIVC